MASYRYERDIDPKDLKPRKERQYSRRERWANWWDYNLKWVLIFGIAGAFVAYCFIGQYFLTTHPDYNVAVVSPYYLPEATVTALQEQLAAYGEDWGKPGSICELLDKLNKVPGLEWIRIMYAYPERITDDFIAAMKRNEKVVPYLDLPIQHCNDTILKNMNRRSTRAELLEVIGKLRREIPGITLRTTLIAGFPGETEEQFEDLCNFVKEVQFDRLGCFAYSAEENTVAARMDGQIEQEVKDKRAELVMQIQTGIMAQKQAEKVGQTVHVLCDGIDEENGLYLCRTTGDAPEVDGCVCVSSEEPLYPGQFYDVLVEDSDLYDLYGTVVK